MSRVRRSFLSRSTSKAPRGRHRGTDGGGSRPGWAGRYLRHGAPASEGGPRSRYPKQPDGNRYPVVDFVICHGDFLNAGRGYVHKNKAVKFVGSYGDILIRDRKMYVVPTPFRLIEGAAHHQTLVLPAEDEPGADFFEVGQLVRSECPEIIIGYSFDLTTNTLTPRTAPNPNAVAQHAFRA
jgi:hypothetical protein